MAPFLLTGYYSNTSRTNAPTLQIHFHLVTFLKQGFLFQLNSSKTQRTKESVSIQWLTYLVDCHLNSKIPVYYNVTRIRPE